MRSRGVVRPLSICAESRLASNNGKLLTDLENDMRIVGQRPDSRVPIVCGRLKFPLYWPLQTGCPCCECSDVEIEHGHGSNLRRVTHRTPSLARGSYLRFRRNPCVTGRPPAPAAPVNVPAQPRSLITPAAVSAFVTPPSAAFSPAFDASALALDTRSRRISPAVCAKASLDMPNGTTSGSGGGLLPSDSARTA